MLWGALMQEGLVQNRWHHEAGKLCGYIEVKVKAWLQMDLPNGQ